MRTSAVVVILVVLRSIGAAAPRAPATSATRSATASGASDASHAEAGKAEAARAEAARADAARADASAHAGAAITGTSGEVVGEVGDDGRPGGPRIPVIGPSIGTVLSAAYATAGLDHDPGHGWIRRARIGGLVPWVTVRTSRDTSWQDAHSEVGHGASLEVRATWRLDRLVFDNHELQVASIESARRRERRRLATRVIRAYFAWRRAAGVVGGPDDDRVVTRVAEATAELDALTDGWFSEEVLRRERTPSEPHGRSATAR